MLQKRTTHMGFDNVSYYTELLKIFDFVSKSINGSNTNIQLVMASLFCSILLISYSIFISSSLASGIKKLILIIKKKNSPHLSLVRQTHCYCIRLEYTNVHTY